MRNTYPDSKVKKLQNNASQIWPAVTKMKPGDWVVLPSKTKPALHFGEITGTYKYDVNAEDPFYHYLDVNWFATDIPRSSFDQDLLYSFGATSQECSPEV